MATISQRIETATAGLEQALSDAGGATGLGEIRQTRAQLSALDLTTRLDRTYIETESGARAHVVNDSGVNKYRYTGLIFATLSDSASFLTSISSKLAANQICFIRETGKVYRVSGSSWEAVVSADITAVNALIVDLSNEIDALTGNLTSSYALKDLSNADNESVLYRHLEAALAAQISTRDLTIEGLWNPEDEDWPVDTTGTMTEYESDVSAWRITTTHEWGAVTYTATGLLVWNGGTAGDATDWVYVEPPPFDVSQIPLAGLVREQLALLDQAALAKSDWAFDADEILPAEFVMGPLSEAPWSNESSSFTGWGSTTQPFPASSSITIKVRSWNADNLISRVRLILRLDDEAGDVVYDDEQSITPAHMVDTDVTFTFPSPIGDGEQEFFLEYYTDGRVGHYRGSSFAVAGNKRGSVTSLTLIDNPSPTMSASTNASATWFKTQPIAVTVISPSDELEAAISEIAEELIPQQSEIDVFRSWMARRWRAGLAQLRYNSTGIVRLGVIGDSWTNAPRRIVDPIRDQLASAGYDLCGPGWISAGEDGLPTSVTKTPTGSWVYSAAQTTSLGPTLTHATSGADGDKMIFTCDDSASWEIHYRTQASGGEFRWRVNAGSWTTVDTAATAGVDVVTVSGAGDLEIEVTEHTATDGVILLGVVAYTAANGVMVHKLGRTGSSGLTWTQVDATAWQASMGALELDTAMIVLGTNDMAQNVTLPTYKSQILELMTRLRAVNPAMDIVLVSPSDNGLERDHAMLEYSAALLELAREDGDCAWVDLWRAFGPYTDANGDTLIDRGIYGDNVHPDWVGGKIIGEQIAQKILAL